MPVRWNKQMTQTTGYQLQYCANKNFRSGTKVKTVSKNKTIRTSVKKLASRKTYCTCENLQDSKDKWKVSDIILCVEQGESS